MKSMNEEEYTQEIKMLGNEERGYAVTKES